MGMFIGRLAAFEPQLNAFSFLFYLTDQTIILVNCTLLLRMLWKTPLREKKQMPWVLPVLALCTWIVSRLSGDGKQSDIRETILLLLPYAETLILFQRPPVLKHIAVIFAYGIFADSPKYLLNGYFPVEKAEKSLELCIDTLLLVVIVIVYAAVRKRIKPAEKLSHLDTLTFLWVCFTVIIFVLTIVVLDVKYGDTPNAWILFVNVLIFSTLIPYILHSMLEARESEAYFMRALDAEIRQFEIIGEKDEDLRRFRHDYANHMRAISAMLEDGKTDAVQAYVEKLGADLKTTARDFYTGNYMLDIILAEKRSAARQDGNDILFEGSFPKSGIGNDDVCTIMANALDNAVEACRNIDRQCEITVKSIVKEDRVAVSITNPTEGKIRITADGAATSKADKSRHGFGLKSIKKTVAKYDGSMHLRADQQMFELFFDLRFI